MKAHPTSLKLIRPDLLRIEWNDGVGHEHPIRLLRERCPCATCRELRMAPPQPVHELVVLRPEETQPLRIVGMRPVGNYASAIHFSDGHDTGIYTLELLRELGDAPEKVAEQQNIRHQRL